VHRHLRPDRIVASGSPVWLVDESWPVAAALRGAGSPMMLDWPWSESPVDPEAGRVVVADGVGVVVQDGAQVAWVRPDGHQVAYVEGGLTLTAADPDVAWFADRAVVNPGSPPAPPPPLAPGRIVALRRDGSRTQIATSAPVNAIGVHGGRVWVTLAEPPVAHPEGDLSWSFAYPSVVLQVAKDALLADGLAHAVPATSDVPQTPLGRSEFWWLEDDADLIRRYGVRAGGLIWWAGAPPRGSKINRKVMVVGHHPESGVPILRADLGLGLVRDAQPVGAELWLSVARRRCLAVPNDRGVEVLAVDPRGATRSVCRADSIDISRFAPPLRRPSDEQIRDHIDAARDEFDHLEDYWHAPDGSTSPLSDSLTDPAISVEDDWPHTRLVVTLRHQRRPGLLLRRTLPLFDERGQPVDHEDAAMLLMEDLDTGYLAPASEAVNGVLDT
jgi:hypothetical protein